MDCSPPGSSVHGILQARILEWAAVLSSGDLPDPGIEPGLWHLLHWQAGFVCFLFNTSVTWEALTVSLFHSNGKFTLIFIFY